MQILVAVTPGSLPGLPAVIGDYQDAGVALGLWPMLDDSDGRWGSTFNAARYSDFVLRVAELVPPGTTMALDLEPPIHLVRRVLRGDGSALTELLRAGSRDEGVRVLRQLIERLRARGLQLLAAVPPIVLGDGKSTPAWQWLMGTPFAELSFDVLSVMSYTSLLEGYSGGLLPRGAALSLHAQTSSKAHLLWPAQASISLGVVGDGALGDERPYRGLDELTEDVAIARACGVDDLGLFDLSGVLRQQQPEAWLDAFAYTEPSAILPRLRRRARLLEGGVTGASHGIRMYRRFRKPRS